MSKLIERHKKENEIISERWYKFKWTLSKKAGQTFPIHTHYMAFSYCTRHRFRSIRFRFSTRNSHKARRAPHSICLPLHQQTQHLISWRTSWHARIREGIRSKCWSKIISQPGRNASKIQLPSSHYHNTCCIIVRVVTAPCCSRRGSRASFELFSFTKDSTMKRIWFEGNCT